jgi:nucleotide-binding universal stress UspA family protein
MKVQRILCPADFSDASHEALHFAADLAKQYGAQLTLLHVYHVPAYPLPDGFVYPRPETLSTLFSSIDKALGDWRSEALERGAREVECVTAEGVPWHQIIARAKEGDYHLIVLGTHGHGRLRHLLVGSTADRVVSQAPCPVLTVRAADARLE